MTDVYSQQVAATDKCTRQLSSAMENASSTSSGVWNNATTLDDDLKLYQAHIRDVALKVTYIVIGTVGVLDNLFILAVFVLFIKITDKVTATANIKNINRRISAMFMSPNRLPDVCKVRILCPFSLRINVMKRGTESYFFPDLPFKSNLLLYAVLKANLFSKSTHFKNSIWHRIEMHNDKFRPGST